MIFPVTKEVRILPDTPQHWNCEFFLETHLPAVLQPQPPRGLPPFEISLSMPRKEASHIPGQGTAVLGSTDEIEGCILSAFTQDMFSLAFISEPVHQLFPCTGNLGLCRNLFPYLPIHICNMPRYLNVSSGSQIPFLLQLVYDKSC